MERFFQIAAVILAGIAAYFLWNGNADGAFVSAVFGTVSFFLSVRFQVKNRLKEREIEREEEEMRRRGDEEQEDSADGGGSRQLSDDAMFNQQLINDEDRRTKDKVV